MKIYFQCHAHGGRDKEKYQIGPLRKHYLTGYITLIVKMKGRVCLSMFWDILAGRNFDPENPKTFGIHNSCLIKVK